MEVHELENGVDLVETLSRHRELEETHRRIIHQLRQANEELQENEEGLRDLFEEAPIAYVRERLDTRIIRANRVATSILGIRPEEISRTYGKSLVPDAPEAQQRMRQAIASFNGGPDANGAVLELRRKDDGKPVWIEWWSRPEPGGLYTRTMFIDITSRVQMEHYQARLEAQHGYLQREILSEQNFGDIVGRSAALHEVLRQIELVAPTQANVLILGESGTGKELIARAIHERSPRKERPLIKVNCGAIPDDLFESEMFGHVKGAFTGAVKDRIGRFELADGGTLFLDEVGEIPLGLQTKLLRVVQEQQFERVGEERTRRVNVRIVAATNRDLQKEVQAGRFRQDLFYRLSTFPVEVPPLRDRREDIPVLIAHFVHQAGLRFHIPPPTIPNREIERAQRYDWPGNVRELQNAVERAVVLGSSDVIRPEDLPDTLLEAPATRADGLPRYHSAVKDLKKDLIVKAVQQANGNYTEAAKALGVHPNYLHRLIRNLDLKESVKTAASPRGLSPKQPATRS